MSAAYASHPSDRVAQAGAAITDSHRLTRAYEDVFDVVEPRRGKLGAYGKLQAVCALAIAYAQKLEDDLAARPRPPMARLGEHRPPDPVVRDERRVRSELYAGGDVIALPKRPA